MVSNKKITDYSKELFEKGITSNDKYLAFTIDDFLTENECKDLIKLTEKKGYEKALVNVGFGLQKYIPEYRNSDRCIIDSENMGELFWNKLKDFIPEKFHGKDTIGLNERMRFLRYDKGNFFEAHMDGSYVRPDGKEVSKVTFFLYLNDGYEGGASTFLKLNDNKVEIAVPPKTGRLLIFQHNIYHKGALLLKGRKYALRTDIMYKNTS